MRILLSLFSLAFLAACGGASTGATVQEPIDVIRDTAERLAADIEAGGVASADAIQVTGTATYTGIAAIGFLAESSNGIGIGGHMRMELDFGENLLSGEIYDFHTREGDAREGSIAIEDGGIARFTDGALVAASLSGDVELLSDTTMQVSGVMLGAFAGSGAENIAGELVVEATFEDAETTGASPISFDGGFLLER